LVDYAKIHRMSQNDDVQERKEAVDQIRINFQNLHDKDKEQAWKDLLALTKDEDCNVRGSATNVKNRQRKTCLYLRKTRTAM